MMSNILNLTQFECSIQSLINFWEIGKNLMFFSCFCHSKHHKTIPPLIQCDFLMMCTLSYGRLFLVSIFYQLTFEKNQVYTGNLTHCRQTLQLIKFLFDQKHEGQ